FARATAAAESPPPTIVVAPRPVAAAIASAIAMVPLSNGDVSKTPIGPFQITVCADAIALPYDSAVLGPISKIASCGFTPSRETACADLASSSDDATIESCGRIILVPA